MRTRIVLLYSILVGLLPASATSAPLLGLDVSFLPQVLEGEGTYRVRGRDVGLFTILDDLGVSTVRLRLWHSPSGGINGLEATLGLAEQARAASCDVLLDLHYSDTWADPGQQAKPAAWQGLSFAALKDSVRAYTRDVMLAFAVRGLAPSIVQLGNEITPGMLFDEGRVGGNFDTPTQWQQLGELLGSAVAGMDEVFDAQSRPLRMIHIDRGGDVGGATWFFDHLVAQGVDFDLIGLSYYPWWHGNLADLDQTLDTLATRYGKGLVVVETAYPWTLGWFDDTHNPVGLPEHLLPGNPATPRGQNAFLRAVIDIVREVPDGLGRGVFWWGGEWISSPGFGSGFENVALFDQNGDALPALGTLGGTAGKLSPRVRVEPR